MAYTILWIIWILMFLAIEGEAVLSKNPHTNTLSAHLWEWASMANKSKGWVFRRSALMLFLIWLFGHLMFHWSVIANWFK